MKEIKPEDIWSDLKFDGFKKYIRKEERKRKINNILNKNKK